MLFTQAQIELLRQQNDAALNAMVALRLTWWAAIDEVASGFTHEGWDAMCAAGDAFDAAKLECDRVSAAYEHAQLVYVGVRRNKGG